MRPKRFIFALIGLALITIILSGCANNSINRKIQTQNNTSQADSAEPAVVTDQTVSGPVTAVPWATDNKFKARQAETGAVVQMAVYCTVLHDPMPGEEENVHLAARILKGTVLQPGSVFSQNNKIGPYTQERGFQKGPMYLGSNLKTTIGGGVCKMASTLYNVAILCNLPIIERHAHGMPVPYVPYGQDATVSYGDKDFIFRNNQSFPILIWAEGVDNRLYVGFYGQAEPPQVEWHHEILYPQPAAKNYRPSNQLPAGTEKVVVQGMDGAYVRSWVTITNPDGTSATRRLNDSSYRPMPYVIEKGV